MRFAEIRHMTNDQLRELLREILVFEKGELHHQESKLRQLTERIGRSLYFTINELREETCHRFLHNTIIEEYERP